MKFSIAKHSHTKALTQTVTSFGLMAITQLATSGVAHAALEDSAKSTGSQIYVFVSIIALIAGAVSLAIGWAMHASGSREGMEKGKKRIMNGFLSVGGVLLTGLAFVWIYNAVAGAGGGLNINWPF